MKKRMKIKAYLLSLLLPVIVLFTTQCEHDFGEEQIETSRKTDSAEPVEPGERQWEKKVYWTGTIDDEFDGSNVLLIMDKKTGGVNKVHDKSFFGGIEIESIEDLTYFTIDADEINKLGINWEKWRQILKIKLPGNSKENVVKAIRHLEKIDGIRSAEPNGSAWPDVTTPNDPDYGRQWGLKGTYGIQAPTAWDITTGSSHVRVGIIDSGIADHPDLKLNLPGQWDTVKGWDFYNNSSVTNDDPIGHGTHVAGIVGAVGNNNEGVSGVCWNVTLIPLQVVYYDSGNNKWLFDISAVIAAIQYATQHGIHILNYSAGWTTKYASEEQAISLYPGLFVCSAGNNNRDNKYFHHYPSNYRLHNLIAVGAIKENGYRPTVADWGYDDKGNPQGSNFSKEYVDVFAPGGSIYSTVPGTYGNMSGTSMAAPHVAGVAALVKSIRPKMTGIELKTALINSVTPLLESDLCITGGRINAYKAINYVTVMGTIDITFNGSGFTDIQGASIGQVVVGKFVFFRDESYTIVERGRFSYPINNFHIGTHYNKLSCGPVPAAIKPYFDRHGTDYYVEENFYFYAPAYYNSGYNHANIPLKMKVNTCVAEISYPGGKFGTGDTLVASDRRKIKAASYF